MNVIVNVGFDRRVKVHVPEAGYNVERHVQGVGWCLDHEPDGPAPALLRSWFAEAIAALQAAQTNTID